MQKDNQENLFHYLTLVQHNLELQRPKFQFSTPTPVQVPIHVLLYTTIREDS